MKRHSSFYITSWLWFLIVTVSVSLAGISVFQACRLMRSGQTTSPSADLSFTEMTAAAAHAWLSLVESEQPAFSSCLVPINRLVATIRSHGRLTSEDWAMLIVVGRSASAVRCASQRAVLAVAFMIDCIGNNGDVPPRESIASLVDLLDRLFASSNGELRALAFRLCTALNWKGHDRWKGRVAACLSDADPAVALAVYYFAAQNQQ